MTRFDPTYRGSYIRCCLQVVLFLALTCVSSATPADTSKSDREQHSVPWNLDSMYQDIRSLIRHQMYKPPQNDMEMKILAWRTTPGGGYRDSTMAMWTALVLARYRDGKWQNPDFVDVDGWAYMLVTRDTAGAYNKGHWFFWMTGDIHGPPPMYYDRQRRLTLADLDTFFLDTPMPIFRNYFQVGGDSIAPLPILEHHIMSATWEEVFGEPPTYRFGPAPPKKPEPPRPIIPHRPSLGLSSGGSWQFDRDPGSVPWNVDSMYRDVLWLLRERMYGVVRSEKDVSMKVLAWRTTPGWEYWDTTVTIWTALTLLRYRGEKWSNGKAVDVERWAFALLSRDTVYRAGEYMREHWRLWFRWDPHGPPPMYYIRDRQLGMADLDTLMSYTPTPMFRECFQNASGDSVGVLPVSEGHIMVAAWEEVFGESPMKMFDLVPPRKEDE